MGYWILVLTAISSFATAVASALSWRLLGETALLRQAQTDPAISLHLEVGRHLNLLNLVIQNYGYGPAFDLRWELQPSLEELKKHDVALLSLALIQGFENMAPKQRIETFFGAANELFATKCPPISVTVHFKNSKGVALSETYVLNPLLFKGMMEVGVRPEAAIVKSLETVAKELSRVTSAGRFRIAASPGAKPWLAHSEQLFADLDKEINEANASTAAEVEPVLKASADPALSPATKSDADASAVEGGENVDGDAA